MLTLMTIRETLVREARFPKRVRLGHSAMSVQCPTCPKADGVDFRWRQPRLASWEVPRRDPAEPRPNAPEVAARRRAARRRWRLRQRAPCLQLNMPLPDLMRRCRQRRKSPRTSLGLYS